HCCEPDHRLLEFASAHNVFIGIDGDITYDKEKQEFMKQIPLKLLVLETDSPFFTPESLRSAGVVLNEPRNLVTTTAFISDLLNLDKHRLYQITLDNSVRLFNLKTRQLS
ncbi:MAG TPA: TatD family hydrolase, partial [Patescibacteria group bacterium]|nr:TatD family hydrolase [Patescibacteria group bacterium]